MQHAREWVVALGLSALACSKSPPGEPRPPQSAATSTIAGRDWVLVSLGDQPAPLGAREQPLTLRLDSASVRLRRAHRGGALRSE